MNIWQRYQRQNLMLSFLPICKWVPFILSVYLVLDVWNDAPNIYYQQQQQQLVRTYRSQLKLMRFRRVDFCIVKKTVHLSWIDTNHDASRRATKQSLYIDIYQPESHSPAWWSQVRMVSFSFFFFQWQIALGLLAAAEVADAQFYVVVFPPTIWNAHPVYGIRLIRLMLTTISFLRQP